MKNYFKGIKQGRLFEDYVHHVYSTLLQYTDESYKVEKRKTIIDRRGISQEIDIYYEIQHLPHSNLGTTIRVLIECKNKTAPYLKKIYKHSKQKLKIYRMQYLSSLAQADINREPKKPHKPTVSRYSPKRIYHPFSNCSLSN